MNRANRTVRGIAAGAVILVALCVAVAGCSGGSNTFDVEDGVATDIADFDYTIPAGAGEAIDRGELLEILPAEIDASVGQSIRIVNNDDRGHLVGVWFVGAGETLSQTFVSAGELFGECTVHPSGQIRVTVSP